AFITDMSQPLGRAVGHALEVREAIEALGGRAPQDLRALALELAAEMVFLAEGEPTRAAARARVEQTWARGGALEAFRRLLRAQGGDPTVVEQPDLLPHARLVETVAAPEDGW